MKNDELIKGRTTYIYGLFEVGKEDEIKYVGKSNNPKNRLRDHLYDKSVTPKTSWIKSVLKKGGKISFKILKEVSIENWEEEEINTINEYNKDGKLKNSDKGGNSGKIKYYKTYNECIEWLKDNKPSWVMNSRDYKKWSKKIDFPDFLPIAPHRVFGDFSWGDYLNNVWLNKNRFFSYNDAKKWLKENMNLKSSIEYRKAKLPYFIPSKPYLIYENEWISWDVFLDFKPFTRKKDNVYYTYEEAKKWIKDNFDKLSSIDYRKMTKNDELPLFMPKKPERYYEKDGFNGYDFFISKKKERTYYYPYDECKKIVINIIKENNIKTSRDWKKWAKTKSSEYSKIPSNPNQFFKDEWLGWDDWLGK